MKTHQLTRRIQWIKGNNIYKPCTNSLSKYTKLRTQTTVFIDSPVKVIGKLIELSLHFIVLLKLPQPIVFVAICLFISLSMHFFSTPSSSLSFSDTEKKYSAWQYRSLYRCGQYQNRVDRCGNGKNIAFESNRIILSV